MNHLLVAWHKLAVPQSHQRLADIATYFPEFKDFSWAFLKGIIGRYWHITHDPDFRVDPEYWASTPDGMAGDTFFCTPTPDQWRFYTSDREWCAEVRLHGKPGLRAGEGDYWEPGVGEGRQIVVPRGNISRVVEVVTVKPYSRAVADSNRYWNSLPQSERALAEIWKEVWGKEPVDRYGEQVLAS